MDSLKRREVVFDNGIIIIEMNKDGVITYANSKFTELTGYSKKEIIGVHYSKHIDPTMPKSAITDIWNTISRKRIWRGYVKSIVKNNKYYWSMVWVQPRFDNKKAVIGYVAILKEAYRSKIDKIDIYLKFLSLVENSSKVPYPYGKELIFGSDFIASKYLDLDLNERLEKLVNKKQYIKLMKYKIDT